MTNVDLINLFEMQINSKKNIVTFFSKLTSDELTAIYNSNKEIFLHLLEDIASISPDVFLKRLLIDKIFYKLYGELNQDFSKYFHDIDYEIIKEFVEKNISFLKRNISINEEIYRKLLDDYSMDKRLITYLIVSELHLNVLTDYFRNNSKSFRVFNHLSREIIISLMKKGVLFSKEQLSSHRFFEIIKENSIIEFRDNINFVVSKLGYLEIEDEVYLYYEKILNSFNPKTKVFASYQEIYDDFLKKSYVDVTEFPQNDLLFEFSIINQPLSMHFLEKLTSKKISEMVIDYLFKDNIYNVFINIHEMFNYDKSNKEKLLSKETYSFFSLILDFDSLSSSEKIRLFHELKDKKVDVLYYDTLRKLKNHSYQEMQESLLEIDESYKRKDLSSKFGVDVYDYYDAHFYLLVRVFFEKWESDTVNNHDCYSLISNLNTTLFNDGLGYVYGYRDFDFNRIMHVFEDDSYSNTDGVKTTKNINRIMHPIEIVLSGNSYSEIQIKNIKSNQKKYLSLRPSYIIAISNINMRIIDEAKRLNIPVILIRDNKRNVKHNYRCNSIDFTYASVFDEASRNYRR